MNQFSDLIAILITHHVTHHGSAGLYPIRLNILASQQVVERIECFLSALQLT